MTRERIPARDFGQLLASHHSIPEYIQVILAGGAMVAWLVLLGFDVGSVFVTIPATLGGSLVLYFLAFRVPALRSSLAVYEHGLESVVQGKTRSFAYDELSAIAAKFTDHRVNHQYIGTRAMLEFFVDGRMSPYVHSCEFRRAGRGERVVALAISQCSQAIERRLLIQLERDGAVRWRDNVALTPDGLLIDDGGGHSRLIGYRQIGDCKMVDNRLQICKAGDGLPFFSIANDEPNFTPLLGLFESLCAAIHNIQPEPVPA
jgi:hypothetical protein